MIADSLPKFDSYYGNMHSVCLVSSVLSAEAECID